MTMACKIYALCIYEYITLITKTHITVQTEDVHWDQRTEKTAVCLSTRLKGATSATNRHSQNDDQGTGAWTETSVVRAEHKIRSCWQFEAGNLCILP